MRTSLVAAVSAVAIAISAPAFAFQRATIGSSGATLYAKPNSKSKVVGTLNEGAPVTLGDHPTNGFYRCTGARRITGWVKEDDVVIAGKSQANAGGNSHSAASTGEAEQKKMYAGLLLGLGIDGGNSAFTFGVDGGYKLTPEWGAGLYFTYASLGSSSAATSVGTVSSSASLIIIAPEANYFFGGNLHGLHATGKLGLGIVSASASSNIAGLPAGTVTSGSASSTGLAIGGGAGYDYMITPQISVGGEGNFLLLTSSGSSTSINFLAAGKFWF